MKNYELSSNEVVLYKGDVTPVEDKGAIRLILTNLNIVFITTHKKFFGKEEIDVESYPVGEIKIYNGVPQLKVQGNIVEIYLLTDEKEIKFSSKSEIHKFINEATNLLTHKTKLERCAEKVKKTINLVKDTIGEDNINAIKNATKDGKIVTTAKAISKGAGIISGIFNKKKKLSDKLVVEKIEE
ncbi:MAG: hypothetical protein IJ371_01400 [Clostridia bacterium]|nr:hypothetical protein [Clostridia bacterium]